MEILGLNSTGRRLRDAGIIIYSLIVMATVIPVFRQITNTIVIPYYIFIPGYCIASLFRDNRGISETLFYSVAWSLAIIASVFAIISLSQDFQTIPLGAVVPVLTLVILVYNHFHGR